MFDRKMSGLCPQSSKTDDIVLAVGSFKETSGAKGVNGNQANHSVKAAGAAYVYY
jgi:hypothetical protein